MPLKSPRSDANSPAVPQPVAIYTRVSTDNQIGLRFESCESQAAYCREEIEREKANGWYEVACLTDSAYSGGTMDRPGIRALKRMIEAGEVKIVLLYKLERVLRSTDEWVPFKAFLKQHGCQLASATEDISEATPSGRLKNNLMMSFAQYERENTSEKTRAKMVQQAKRGIWNGGLVPYGYLYDKNTQQLQPEPREAEIVKKIFDQASRLVSLTDVANKLNAEGRRTKERVWRRRDGSEAVVGGRRFRCDGLRLLFQNPIYRGSVRFAGQEYSAKHPALVSADVWDKANAATAETQPRPGHLFRERDTHNHLLKGVAWCGACGRALVPNDSGKKSVSGVKYRYYTCSLVMRETAAAPCAVGRLSADALEKAVAALIGEAGRHPMIIAEMIATSRTLRRGDRESLRAEVKQLQRSIAELDAQLRNCADAVAKGGVAGLADVLVRHATELRAERQEAVVREERKRGELALCERTVLEEKRVVANLKEFGEAFPNLAPQQRKELVRLFVERVEVRRARAGASRAKPGDASPDPRLMELRVKLYLPELASDMSVRAETDRVQPRVFGRGLSLNGKVDFTHAQRGEVTIVAPFRQTFRLDDRVRVVPPPKPVIEHPIIRALKWQRLLDEKAVPHRFALAKHVGCTPGAVTKTLRLIKLAPEIQQFLVGLKTRPERCYFSLTRMGALADLDPVVQRAAFATMRENFSELQGRVALTNKEGAMPHTSARSQLANGTTISSG